MNSSDSDSGEIISPEDALPSGSIWMPVQGHEVRGLLAHALTTRS
jgi:hypothetical protein